jgi:hypothetical protein
MAKVDKLALVRLALRHTLLALDTKEKLCVLADLYNKPEDETQPRWYGNGSGTNGLEQGIYNYMTTFRRVSNLWAKIQVLTPDIKHETVMVRDLLFQSLQDSGINLDEISEKSE